MFLSSLEQWSTLKTQNSHTVFWPLVSECVSKYLAAVFVVSCWMVCCWLLRALLLLRKEVDEKDRKNVAKKKKAEKMRWPAELGGNSLWVWRHHFTLHMLISSIVKKKKKMDYNVHNNVFITWIYALLCFHYLRMSPLYLQKERVLFLVFHPVAPPC